MTSEEKSIELRQKLHQILQWISRYRVHFNLKPSSTTGFQKQAQLLSFVSEYSSANIIPLILDLLSGSSYENNFTLVGQGRPQQRYLRKEQTLNLINLFCKESNDRRYVNIVNTQINQKKVTSTVASIITPCRGDSSNSFLIVLDTTMKLLLVRDR